MPGCIQQPSRAITLISDTQNKLLDHTSLCLVSFHIESNVVFEPFFGFEWMPPKSAPRSCDVDVRPFWLMKKLRGREWDGIGMAKRRGVTFLVSVKQVSAADVRVCTAGN